MSAFIEAKRKEAAAEPTTLFKKATDKLKPGDRFTMASKLLINKSPKRVEKKHAAVVKSGMKTLADLA